MVFSRQITCPDAVSMSVFPTFTAPYEGVSRRRACGRCHARKVRCDFNNGNGPCTNCIAGGDKCELQSRKRRTPRNNGPRNSQRQGLLESPAAAAGDTMQETSPQFIDSSLLSPRSLHQLEENGRGSNPIRNHSVLSAHDATPRAQASSSPANSPYLRRLRTASFVNRGAILPDAISGLDKNADQPEPDISEVDLTVLKLYHAFDLPPRAVRQSLVDAFFEHCWTWMPVIDPDPSISESQSYLLLQALFVAGSQMRVNGSRYASTEEYLRRAKALLDTSYEKEPLILLAALCIIQWFNSSAPNRLSTTTSRFWVMYGVNIAQQIGLHRKSPDGAPFAGLRRRIWWSLYARDCLISSAHGRPRAINLADCTIERPEPEDFPQPTDERATIFCFYVSICGILGDLCEMLNRDPTLSAQRKTEIGEALLNWLRSLPVNLRLFDNAGYPNRYNFEVSRLYISFFTAIMILYRPPSIFWYHPSCAAAIIASRMACQLFESFLLRDQVHFLSGAYAWQLLVTAIPQLSCATIPSMKNGAETALNGLEDVLRALARKLKSAANNLKNVQLLRNTLRRGGPSQQPISARPTDESSEVTFDPILLFSVLGGNTVHDYEQLLCLEEESQELPITASFDASLSQITLGYDHTSDFNIQGNGPAEFTETDWILDLMNGLSSWRS